MIDLALTGDKNGKPVLHRADCPEVQRQRAAGHMVFSMYGCENMPPKKDYRWRWHSCLDVEKPGD